MRVRRPGVAALLWAGLLSSDTAAQLLIKIGSVRTAAAGRLAAPLVLGYALVGVSFLLWMQILRVGRLSISLSVTALLYVTIPLASHFLLGEALPPALLAGAALVGLGVFVIGGEEEDVSSCP